MYDYCNIVIVSNVLKLNDFYAIELTGVFSWSSLNKNLCRFATAKFSIDKLAPFDGARHLDSWIWWNWWIWQKWQYPLLWKIFIELFKSFKFRYRLIFTVHINAQKIYFWKFTAAKFFFWNNKLLQSYKMLVSMPMLNI